MDGRWSDFPKPLFKNAVCKWWFNLQDEFLSSKRGVYYISDSKDLTGCEAERQLDLFVKPSNEKLSKVVYNWKDVKVIRELKMSNNDKKKILL